MTFGLAGPAMSLATARWWADELLGILQESTYGGPLLRDFSEVVT